MALPELTHLQICVLEILNRTTHDGKRARITGDTLRQELHLSYEINSEGPAFYMLMARMKKFGYLQSNRDPAGVTVGRQCRYLITPKGIAAFEDAKEHYTILFD